MSRDGRVWGLPGPGPHRGEAQRTLRNMSVGDAGTAVSTAEDVIGAEHPLAVGAAGGEEVRLGTPRHLAHLSFVKDANLHWLGVLLCFFCRTLFLGYVLEMV